MTVQNSHNSNNTGSSNDNSSTNSNDRNSRNSQPLVVSICVKAVVSTASCGVELGPLR